MVDDVLLVLDKLMVSCRTIHMPNRSGTWKL